MTFLLSVMKELLGLFVDDGALAVQILILVAVIAGAVKLLGLAALAGALLLPVGCILILAGALRRVARR